MRFHLLEITGARVYAAARRRIADVPHALRWRISEQASANRRLLERYRDRHRGDRCVIVGNGPSVARMDLATLRNEISFGMNRIYLLFEQKSFRPTYYTCVNELVLEQFHADIAKLEMPRFLGWNRRHLFPRSDDTMFLRTGYPLVDFFGADATRAICSGGTVTFVTLQLAYFMGFEEVVLIGVDHKFSSQGTPNRTEVRQGRDENHFHPDYFPRGSRWQLPDLLRSELAYELAREAFERAGRRVIDATVGGQCRVFPKADYASLFSGAA